MSTPLTTAVTPTPRRRRGAAPLRTAASLAAPRHDARAWLAFAFVATLLLATMPLTGTASAQLPDGLPIPGGEEEQPEDDGSGADDEQDEEEDGGSPLPVAPPGGDDGGEDGGDEGSGAGQEQAPPGGEFKTAYFTSPTSQLMPGTIAVQQAQCILVPESCTPDAQQITGPVIGGVGSAQGGTNTATAPAPEPVPPGDLPVGLLNGNQRYASAIDIGPPDVTDGKVVQEYLLSFQMSSLSFSLESPAFREFIEVTLTQSSSGSPQDYGTLLQAIATQEQPAFTTDFPGLEACLIIEPWEAGEDQPREAQPEIDFFYCSPRAEPDENDVVTFDLTFLAADHHAGFINWEHGLLIRPLAAQNLAFGDADYTTNYYAYLENPSENPPSAEVSEADEPTPVPTTPPGTNNGSGGGSGSSGSGGSGSSSGGGRGSSGSGSTSSGTSGSRPSSPAASSPATSAVPPTGDSGAVESAVGDPVATALDAEDPFAPVAEEAEEPSSFPIAWLLLPMMIGGAFWYGRVLDGAPVTQVVRAGAMTRLLRERGFSV